MGCRTAPEGQAGFRVCVRSMYKGTHTGRKMSSQHLVGACVGAAGAALVYSAYNSSEPNQLWHACLTMTVSLIKSRNHCRSFCSTRRS